MFAKIARIAKYSMLGSIIVVSIVAPIKSCNEVARQKVEAAKTPEQRAAEAREAEEREAAKAREALQDIIMLAFMDQVQQSMKNPSSLEWDRRWTTEDGTVCATYYATNSFNATVPGHAVLYKGKISYNAKTFIKHCN